MQTMLLQDNQMLKRSKFNYSKASLQISPSNDWQSQNFSLLHNTVTLNEGQGHSKWYWTVASQL